MLDYIYKPVHDNPGRDLASGDGNAILAYTTECPAARAVRNRRALLATAVDSMADSCSRLRIASLACGYLREAELMSSIELGCLERYYALDQDDECVQHVVRRFRDTSVQAMSGSVRDLLKRATILEGVCDLDFFYAAGIFDYLTDRVAEALVAEMFRRLRPRGILWIPNFVPHIPDRAYMEAFMDWWLIYRSPDALGKLDAKIPRQEIASKRIFTESEGNVAFLELIRI